jgi:tripartite-type tricarboxylate transporter receptor subunit TctC
MKTQRTNSNVSDVRRKTLKTLFLPLTVTALSSWPALAQTRELPVGQVKIICGFPPGGTTDITGRLIGGKISDSVYTKNHVVIENKTGASGRLAIEAVKNSVPDGSTLLVSSYSMLVLYPYTSRNLTYDPFKDFAPVAIGSAQPVGLAVGPMVPTTVKNVKDFIAWCKANPDRANYASPGAGAIPHLLGTLLSLNSEVSMQHVAYRGSVPGVTDLIGGQVASMLTPLGDFLSNHRAGKLRILATSGKSRSRFAPEVASFAEQGYPELSVEIWFGFYAPAKTPSNVVAAANTAINNAIKNKTVVDGLSTLGLTPVGGNVEEVTKEMHRLSDYWGPIIKRIGFTEDS